MNRVHGGRLAGGFLEQSRGFTLVELLLVVAIIAMVSAGVSLAVRDSGQTELEREGQRVVALLESARARSRASGVPVYWHASAQGFEFIGLPPARPVGRLDSEAVDPAAGAATTPWLAAGVSVRGDAVVLLGPEPIIERREIVLEQGSSSLRIASDGLRPFSAQPDVPVDTAGTVP